MEIEGLDKHARAVAERVLTHESTEREHVVVALSGAHAYGFPSPDSDLDLKAVHMDPTVRFLGLRTKPTVKDRLEVIDGVEIDYTSNELGPVVLGLIGGNGNYVERVLGALIMRSSPALEELASLTRGAFSRRLFHHYAGFANSQRVAFENGEPRAKRLLYVLRTALTGVHALRTGELRVPLEPNAREYGYDDAVELIEAKRSGENVVLEDALAERWRERLDAVFAALVDARDASPLPDEADPAPLEAWLVRERLAQLDRS